MGAAVLDTFILSTSRPGAGHISRRNEGLHSKSLCSLQLQGEMSWKWLENKPHQRWMNVSSPNFHFLCPSAIPYWHCVEKGTSMLRQLFLCCPVFAIRTGPREIFCSWFCTAHPVSAEFIYREERDTRRPPWPLQDGKNISLYSYYFHAEIFYLN